MNSRFFAVTTGIFAAALWALPLAAQGQGQNPNQDQHPDGRGNRTRQAPPRGNGGFSVPSGNGISFHGGPVMMGTKNVYYIFYGNWSSNPSAVTLLINFASNLGGSQYFNINTSYTDSGGTAIPNQVHFAGSTTDNYSRGTALTDGDIQTIVSTAINGGKLPLDSNGVYFVLTSADVNEVTGFCTQYCGWHTYGTINGTTIKYSFVGNADRCPSACADQSPGPNGTTGPDGMVSVIAHELEEATTDPQLNAWYDSAGNENADKCAWTFGSTQTASNGSRYNLTLGGAQYLIQQNWVNASGGYCALSYTAAPPSPDFSLSTSPTSRSVVQGSPASYTVTITPSNGFASGVNLSVAGVPANAIASFSPNPATGSSTLTVNTAANTPTGTSTMTITGTSGTLTHTTSATLVVTAPPKFTVAVLPSSRTVSRGGSTTYSVTVTPLNGFNSSVSLSVSGLPNRASGSFSPNSFATGGGTSTLTVKTAKQSHGTSTLTISATGGGQTQTATATIAVN